MPEDRTEYLATGSGGKPADAERLDMIRAILADEAVWSEPPPEVGVAISDALASVIEPAQIATARRRRWPWVAGVAAAALIAVVIGLTGTLGDRSGEIVVAIEGTELASDATAEATMRPTGDGWWIRLEVAELEAAPVGTYYEGWVWSDRGDGVSIGTFHFRGGGDSVVLWSGVDPTDYPSIWVTLEDEDGDPSASDQVVLRGRIAASG